MLKHHTVHMDVHVPVRLHACKYEVAELHDDPARRHDCMLARMYACRTPRSPIYSDRFIPSRAASSRLQGYSLLDRAEASSQEVTR